MPYKKGDVLMSDRGERRKVLEVTGCINHTSSSWDETAPAEDILRYSQQCGGSWTDYDLDQANFTICPPDQTLLPAEKWVPRQDEIFFSGIIMSDGTANFVKNNWEDIQTPCVKMLAIGNVHKTSEEAIEWACKRYGITKP